MPNYFFGTVKAGVLFLSPSFHKMADSESDEFSGDDLYGDLPSDFDLAELDEEERRAVDEAVNIHESDSDSDDIDDENLPLFYHRRPPFEWTGGNFTFV